MARGEFKFKAHFGAVKVNGKLQESQSADIYAETKEQAIELAEKLARANRLDLVRVEWA